MADVPTRRRPTGSGEAGLGLLRGWWGLGLVVFLGGCSGWVSEENKYYMRKEWEEFKGHNWRETTGEVSGWYALFPPPERREAMAERELCLHTNGENRVTTQTGVSDKLGYRRCVLAPYGDARNAGGVRMRHRPDS